MPLFAAQTVVGRSVRDKQIVIRIDRNFLNIISLHISNIKCYMKIKLFFIIPQKEWYFQGNHHAPIVMECCETFHDYYLIEVYTPFALTVTLYG